MTALYSHHERRPADTTTCHTLSPRTSRVSSKGLPRGVARHAKPCSTKFTPGSRSTKSHRDPVIGVEPAPGSALWTQIRPDPTTSRSGAFRPESAGSDGDSCLDSAERLLGLLDLHGAPAPVPRADDGPRSVDVEHRSPGAHPASRISSTERDAPLNGNTLAEQGGEERRSRERFRLHALRACAPRARWRCPRWWA